MTGYFIITIGITTYTYIYSYIDMVTMGLPVFYYLGLPVSQLILWDYQLQPQPCGIPVNSYNLSVIAGIIYVTSYKLREKWQSRFRR